MSICRKAGVSDREQPLSTPEEFDEAFSRLRSEPRKRAWVWVVYLLILIAAIPWYWPEGYVGPVIMGFPTWVAVSLFCVFLSALWTTFAIHYTWREEEEEAGQEGEGT